MRVFILTFDGFNEIDSFVPLNILNRVDGLTAEIAAPSENVRSMNGVTVQAQQPLEHAGEADAVIFGSGRLSASHAKDESLMDRLRLDPGRQLIVSQCSGALFLAALGLVTDQPVCTDHSTRPVLERMGVEVLNRPFFARAGIATAGGCLSGHYLAAWLIWQLRGKDCARAALEYVVPVAEEDEYIERALEMVAPFIGEVGPIAKTGGAHEGSSHS